MHLASCKVVHSTRNMHTGVKSLPRLSEEYLQCEVPEPESRGKQTKKKILLFTICGGSIWKTKKYHELMMQRGAGIYSFADRSGRARNRAIDVLSGPSPKERQEENQMATTSTSARSGASHSISWRSWPYAMPVSPHHELTGRSALSPRVLTQGRPGRRGSCLSAGLDDYRVSLSRTTTCCVICAAVLESCTKELEDLMQPPSFSSFTFT
jgi:hypothetical protein